MAGERPGHTLGVTGLVHEAWLRLRPENPAENDPAARAAFLKAAAGAMRRALVDHARRRGRLKRGGGRGREPLGDPAAPGRPPDEALAVHEALGRLAADDLLAAELVELRYFAGCTLEEAAAAAGVSRATAARRWAYARARLRCDLGPPPTSDRPENP